DRYEVTRNAEFDGVHALPGGFLDPPYLFRGGPGTAGRVRAGRIHPAAKDEVHAYDVGLAPGDREDSLAAAADRQGWMRLLHRLGHAPHPLDLVVLSGKREEVVTEQPLEDGDRLLEAIYSSADGIVRNPRLVVVDGHPPGPQSKFEAAARKQIERRQLLGE